MFSLDTSSGAVFFFVPNKSENHAHICAGSLLYQVGLVQLMRRSILRDAVLAKLIPRP